MSHPQLMNSASGRFYKWGKTSGKKTSGNQESRSREVEKVNTRGDLKGKYTIGKNHQPAKTYNA